MAASHTIPGRRELLVTWYPCSEQFPRTVFSPAALLSHLCGHYSRANETREKRQITFHSFEMNDNTTLSVIFLAQGGLQHTGFAIGLSGLPTLCRNQHTSPVPLTSLARSTRMVARRSLTRLIAVPISSTAPSSFPCSAATSHRAAPRRRASAPRPTRPTRRTKDMKASRGLVVPQEHAQTSTGEDDNHGPGNEG